MSRDSRQRTRDEEPGPPSSLTYVSSLNHGLTSRRPSYGAGVIPDLRTDSTPSIYRLFVTVVGNRLRQSQELHVGIVCQERL